MVQFNLLPDIKIQYLKAKRQKHLVLLTSVITIIASVGLLIIFASIVFGLQKKNISDLSRDINASAQELKGTPDLTKMLTVQNQLRALPGLHEDKAIASRIFDYIAKATPNEADISRLNVDFTQFSISISGVADNLVTVNKFTDTLKFTTFKTKSAPNDEKRAFSSVVLSSFARDSQGASYTITLTFDATIFSESEEVTLTVPSKTTTRSGTEQSGALFNQGGGE